jgi:hypothetical protein
MDATSKANVRDRASVHDVLDRILDERERLGRQLDEAQTADRLVAALVAPRRWSDRIGEVYTTGQLRRFLPGSDHAPISDEAVRDRRRNGRLIGFKTVDDRWAFPAFQFEVRPGRLQLRREVVELWSQLPWRSSDPLELIAWLIAPRSDLGGSAPVDHVQQHGVDDFLRSAVGRLRGRLLV